MRLSRRSFSERPFRSMRHPILQESLFGLFSLRTPPYFANVTTITRIPSLPTVVPCPQAGDAQRYVGNTHGVCKGLNRPQRITDTVGELKTGCKTGQKSTILSRPKALIRVFVGFANSIRPFLGHFQIPSSLPHFTPHFCFKTASHNLHSKTTLHSRVLVQ